jgi:hypothetical protein
LSAAATRQVFLELEAPLHYLGNRKYGHPEYSDRQVDGLMQYFRFDKYDDFMNFLKKYRND